MRKLLLTASLCMIAALVLPGTASAQSASASASASATGAEGNPCGGFVQGSPEADQCYADLGVEPPSGDVGLATSVPPSESAIPAADPCPDPDFPRQTPDGCQASDLPDVVPGASVSPSASASASATATASASTSALPETGGVSPGALASFALPSLALLVAGGMFAARIVRRG